jgi:transposase
MLEKDRISMDMQAQIIRLYAKGYSVRKIAGALQMCRRTVRRYVSRERDKSTIKAQAKSESSCESMVKEEAEKMESKEHEAINKFPGWLKKLDWRWLINEKRKGVPVTILYKESLVNEVKYWSFYNNLKKLEQVLYPLTPKTTMRLTHNPGEKAFVDYGDGIKIVNPETGEETKTWIFVATLPFSSKVYAEFTFDQKLPTFVSSHERAWKFFGGVPRYVVCDNLKSAVNKAHIYDPDVNKKFVSYANHAGFAVLPARPYKPKDKANVETHVGILQRSFFQEVRNQIFSSIGELNQALFKFLLRFNENIMKDYGVSRNQRFEKEVHFLQELPIEEFVFPEIKIATVHPDCHIQFGNSFYSAPWQYVGKNVRVISTNQVSIYDILTLERIAIHPLAQKPGSRKTNELHWPPEKKEHNDFNIEKAKSISKSIGGNTYKMVIYLFDLPHPLIYLRRIQGWLRLFSAARCSKQAMEYASKMALQHQKFNSSYFIDCVKYFDTSALNSPINTGAPSRQQKHLYLHKGI